MLRFCSRIVTSIALLLSQAAFAGPGVFPQGTTLQLISTLVSVTLGSGYKLMPSQVVYGDGSNGALVMPSSGTTTLTADVFYTNLSWPASSTAVINCQNQRIFVSGTLDLTNAPAGALQDDGGNGGNGANNNTGNNGGAGSNVAVGTNLTGKPGIAGGAGGTTTGTESGASSGGNVITGANGGAGGAGGLGPSGAGGAARSPAAVTAWTMRDIAFWYLPASGSGGQVFTSGGAPGGSGGGGDGTNFGGGGGGGGGTGQTCYISAHQITTGVSTPAGVIQCNGGNGGAGGNPTTGNTGGGGGGGGGAGGWCVVKYDIRVGPTVVGGVSATGGTHGTGGTAHGTGSVSGSNGANGTAGLIQILNMSTGVYTTSTSGAANL